MRRETNIIYEAIANLEEITGQTINAKTKHLQYDAIITIGKHTFYVESKTSARKSNVGLILSRFQELNANKNWLLVVDYLAKDVAKILQQHNYNYLDTAGNAHIKAGKLFIHVEGKKNPFKEKKNQSRAFQEVGLKLLLLLISDPQCLQISYRELADKTGISLGSVSNIFTELKDAGFLFTTKGKRVLKNMDALLDRWVIAYNEILKPRMFRKKYRLANEDNDFINLNTAELGFVWGGEAAAGIISHYFKSNQYSIYYDEDLPTLIRNLKLVPDNTGNIEVYNTFWTKDLNLKYPNTAPPLVLYADLIGSNSSRNIEVAKIILENGL